MWSTLSLCSFLIYASYAEENIGSNSTKPLTSSRIIGGSAANNVDFPYHVALLEDDEFSCGGSLIKWNWVLTAAHCTAGVAPAQLKIRAGSKYWKSGGILSNIIAIFQNPTYTRETLTHDSSLLKTALNLQPYANTYSIAVIGLATSLPSTDTNVYLAGWGDTSIEGTPPSDQVQSVILKMIDYDLCDSSYNRLDSSMFCAGEWEGGLGFCRGDSGGGLRYGENLIGIVSYSALICADKGFPGVYSSIPALRDWILDTIQKN